MATLNDRAQACADVLEDLYANRPAADLVRLLAHQRAELLEALKAIKEHPSEDAYELRQYAIQAITKAEQDLSGETNAL